MENKGKAFSRLEVAHHIHQWGSADYWWLVGRRPSPTTPEHFLVVAFTEAGYGNIVTHPRPDVHMLNLVDRHQSACKLHPPASYDFIRLFRIYIY